MTENDVDRYLDLRMKARKSLSVFLSLLFACSTASLAVAKDQSVFATHVNPDGTVAVPKYLFHWSSLNGMVRAAKNHPGSKVLPMKTMRDSDFADLHALPESMEALFAWSHPTAAMAVNEYEEYARGPHPVLLTMKPNPSAKVMVVTSVVGQPNVDLAAAWSGTKKNTKPDLILNLYKRKKADLEFTSREWIILNPNSIAWYSANPNDFPEEVKDEIANTPLRPIEKNEEFYPDYISPDPELRLHRIRSRNSLKVDELTRHSTLQLRDIPPEFIMPHPSCESLPMELSRLLK